MKTRLISTFLLATALSASVLSAAAKNEAPVAYPTFKIVLHSSRGDDQVSVGDSREKVRMVMECPNRELSRDVWLYHGFTADLPQANRQGCRSMLITFTDGKVSEMQFVNMPAVTTVAANLKLGRSVKIVASSK